MPRSTGLERVKVTNDVLPPAAAQQCEAENAGISAQAQGVDADEHNSLPYAHTGWGEGLLVVLLFSVVAWAPLLCPGFIQTHTGLGAVYDALSAGGPLSGWLPSYGVPGDGPLATWLVIVLRALFGPLDTVKLLYAAGFVLSGAGMYWLARRLVGGGAALAAAAIYVFMPYHLAVVYVRGAQAEALMLGLAPFLCLALLEAQRSQRRAALVAAFLLAAALVLTNAGLGVLFALMAVFVTNALSTESTMYAKSLSWFSLVAGLLLGLIVLLPGGGRGLASMPGWREHFVYPFQLFSPLWGFGQSMPGWQDSMPLQIGLVPLALGILALWLAYESANATDRRHVLTLWALAAVPVILSVTIAAPLWAVLPLSVLVAYPWQLLALALIPLALLAGVATRAIAPAGKTASFTLLAVLLAAIVLGSYSYLTPRFITASDMPGLGRLPLAQLGEDIRLLDARVTPQAQPGGTVSLTAIWQALKQPADDYTVFTHLIGPDGRTYGQLDTRPRNGQKPTSSWLPGEVVSDTVVIPVAAGAPPGDYHVDLGMYTLATMQRLPIGGTGESAWSVGPISIR